MMVGTDKMGVEDALAAPARMSCLAGRKMREIAGRRMDFCGLANIIDVYYNPHSTW